MLLNIQQMFPEYLLYARSSIRVWGSVKGVLEGVFHT